MNKFLILMLTSLLLLTSCDGFATLMGGEENDTIDYTTLTQDKFDQIADYLYVMNIFPDTDNMYEDYDTAYNSAYEAYSNSGNEETVTFNGSGYTGTVTVSGEYSYSTSTSLTAAFSNLSASTRTVDFTYSGTFVSNTATQSTHNYIEETGSSTMVEDTKIDLTISGGEISSIIIDFNSYFSYSAAEYSVDEYEPTVYTGTVTVDGINYKMSEFIEFEPTEEQYTTFVGTWAGITAMDITGDGVADDVTYDLILTESTFEMTMTYLDFIIYGQKGTLETDGDQVTLTPTHEVDEDSTWAAISDLIISDPDQYDSTDLEPFTMTWSVNGDTLILDENEEDEMSFTKQ